MSRRSAALAGGENRNSNSIAPEPLILFLRVTAADIELLDAAATTEEVWQERRPLRRPVLDALSKLQRRQQIARFR